MDAAGIEFVGISKRFGAVAANRDIDLRIGANTIHGIVGENGAGKSTLMSILYGMVTPDAGEIRIGGKPAALRSAADAIALGVGMVHQHFQLVETMTVAENLLLNAPISLRQAQRDMRAALRDLDARYGLTLDPDALVVDLPVGVRQRLEIVKTLLRGADILILDEPTAVLTPDEARQLFQIVLRLKDEGRTVILITHKLREIMAVTDRVTVMRAGRIVADLPTEETDETALATLMIGRKPDPPAAGVAVVPGPVVLAASGLTTSRLGPIDIELHEGEITGIAGVSGNGQTELLEALAGLVAASGQLTWRGTDIPAAGRARALRTLGLGHVPEDRLRTGLVPAFTGWESMLLGMHETMARRGLLHPPALKRWAWQRMADWDVRPANETLPTRSFSGGNQQKLVCARELGHNPAALLVGQPTRGVDIGAIELIHRRLLDLKAAGTTILLVSSELDEILALSDRVLVMVGGRIVGELSRAEATEARLGRLMGGLAAA